MRTVHCQCTMLWHPETQVTTNVLLTTWLEHRKMLPWLPSPHQMHQVSVSCCLGNHYPIS